MFVFAFPEVSWMFLLGPFSHFSLPMRACTLWEEKRQMNDVAMCPGDVTMSALLLRPFRQPPPPPSPSVQLDCEKRPLWEHCTEVCRGTTETIPACHLIIIWWYKYVRLVIGIITCLLAWRDIHPGRVEPESPRANQGDLSCVVSTPRSPVPASLLSNSSQACPVCERRGVRSSHKDSCGLNPGDARDRGLIGRGVLITPPFVGPFCRSVGAQSTVQAWLADPLTLLSLTWGLWCDEVRGLHRHLLDHFVGQ